MCDNCNCDKGYMERALDVLKGDDTNIIEIANILQELVDDVNRKDIIIDDMESKIQSLNKLLEQFKGGM